MNPVVIMLVFGIIALSLVLVMFVLLIIDNYSSSSFFCRVFDWHHPSKETPIGFDGASMTSKCRRCHKEILCDSNGDWF